MHLSYLTSTENNFSVPPHIIPFDFGTDALNAGDYTSIYCTINKGDNPIYIEWFLNGKPIPNDHGININRYDAKVSNLNLNSVQAEHSGKYTCKATNWAGSAYYTAILSVNGLILWIIFYGLYYLVYLNEYYFVILPWAVIWCAFV